MMTTLSLPLSRPRKKNQSQLQLQRPPLLPLHPLRRKHQPALRRRRRPQRLNQPKLLQLKQPRLPSLPRMVMKLLPRPTPRLPRPLPLSLQVSAPPISRRRRRSVPNVLFVSVSRSTRPRTKPKRLNAHSALASKPALFPRAWTRLFLSAGPSAAAKVTMVKATKRGGA